jgi:hypothetical protein
MASIIYKVNVVVFGHDHVMYKPSGGDFFFMDGWHYVCTVAADGLIVSVSIFVMVHSVVGPAGFIVIMRYALRWIQL